MLILILFEFSLQITFNYHDPILGCGWKSFDALLLKHFELRSTGSVCAVFKQSGLNVEIKITRQHWATSEPWLYVWSAPPLYERQWNQMKILINLTVSLFCQSPNQAFSHFTLLFAHSGLKAIGFRHRRFLFNESVASHTLEHHTNDDQAQKAQVRPVDRHMSSPALKWAAEQDTHVRLSTTNGVRTHSRLKSKPLWNRKNWKIRQKKNKKRKKKQQTRIEYWMFCRMFWTVACPWSLKSMSKTITNSKNSSINRKRANNWLKIDYQQEEDEPKVDWSGGRCVDSHCKFNEFVRLFLFLQVAACDRKKTATIFITALLLKSLC